MKAAAEKEYTPRTIGKGELRTFADLDGDGRPDFLVSAENGKVYAFRRDEIFAGNPRFSP